MEKLAKQFLFFLLILFCTQHLHSQSIDFHGREFKETIDRNFWSNHQMPQGIDIYPDTPNLSDYSYWHFLLPTSFNSSTFDSSTDFYRVRFHSITDFSNAKFNSNVNFGAVTFDGLTGFDSTQFKNPVYFLNTIFKGKVNFASSILEDSVNFTEAKFGDYVSFRNVTFKGRVVFDNAQLPESLDFRDINTSEIIDFTYCRPPKSGQKCKIALLGSDLSYITIDMKAFQLWFPERKLYIYDNNTIVDTMITPIKEQITSFYEKFLAKLRNDGFLKSYEIVEKDYRKYLKDNGGVWQRCTYYLNKWWWDFGYSKERIIFWTIAFWLFATLLNSFCYRKLQKEVYSIEFVKYTEFENELVTGYAETRARLKDSNWIQELISYIMAIFDFIFTVLHYFGPILRVFFRYTIEVLVYTAVIFFGLKIDTDKFEVGAARKHPFLFTWIMTTYTIGLICIGFLANWIFTS